MDDLRAVVPIVVGALVAGLSALIKTVFERRDERLTAHRQLELASKRTEFVTGWLAVCRTIDSDESFAASANDRARVELEEAYQEAQHALAGSHSALTRSRSDSLVEQLLTVLMLNRRHRRISYVAVSVFYVLVLTIWAGVSSDPRSTDGTPNEDYWAWWQYAIVAAVMTVLLRVLFGLLVSWIERRASPASPAGPRRGDAGVLPPPASLTTTTAEPRT